MTRHNIWYNTSSQHHVDLTYKMWRIRRLRIHLEGLCGRCEPWAVGKHLQLARWPSCSEVKNKHAHLLPEACLDSSDRGRAWGGGPGTSSFLLCSPSPFCMFSFLGYRWLKGSGILTMASVTPIVNYSCYYCTKRRYDSTLGLLLMPLTVCVSNVVFESLQ